MLGAGGPQKQPRRINRAGASTTIGARRISTLPRVSTSTPSTRRPSGEAIRRSALTPVSRVTLPPSRAGRRQRFSASPLASNGQGKPSQVQQRMQPPPSPCWIETGSGKGLQALRASDRRRASRSAGRAGWRDADRASNDAARSESGPGLAAHAHHRFGAGIGGLHLGIAQRPGRRDAVGMVDRLEVAGAQAHHRGAVDLGVSADIVVDAGIEAPAARRPSRRRGSVALPVEDRVDGGVLLLPRQEGAALDTCTFRPQSFSP